MNIGKNIAEYRKSAGMTQEQLAEIIGVSAQAVSKWENGANQPDIMLIPVIAGVFDVTIDELFGSVDSKRTLTFENIPAETYRTVRDMMQKSFDFEEESKKRMNEDMRDDEKCLSMVYSDRGGCTFYNRDIAVCLNAPDAEKLLGDTGAIEKIVDLLDENVLRVMYYFIHHASKPVTPNFIAKNCDLTADEVNAVINKLGKFQLCGTTEREIDGEKIILVEENMRYKLSILLSILYLADLFGKNLWYHGYVGVGNYAWLK